MAIVFILLFGAFSFSFSSPSFADEPSPFDDLQIDITQTSKAVSKLYNEVRGFASPPFVFSARITTESGVPTSTSDRTAQSTVYLTPYKGSKIALYDGSKWVYKNLTEISIALSGLTSGANYDVFVYLSGATPTLELSTVWTNDTTRADALTTLNGVLVKSSANTRRFAGTIRTTATTTTEDSITKRFVWNFYNREPRPLSVVDTTDSYSDAANSWSNAMNNANARVQFVSGNADTRVVLDGMIIATHSSSSGAGKLAACGMGVDSSSVNSALLYGGGVDGGWKAEVPCVYHGYPGLGYHYIQWLERSHSSGTTTFYGDNGLARWQSGMTGLIFN